MERSNFSPLRITLGLNRRPLTNFLAAAILVVLLPVLLYHLIAERQRFDRISEEVSALFLITKPAESLRDSLDRGMILYRESGRERTPKQSEIDHSPPLTVPLLPLSYWSTTTKEGPYAELDHCRDIRRLNNAKVSFACIAVLAVGTESRTGRPEAGDRVSQVARSILPEAWSDLRRVEVGDGYRPRLLFTHMVVEDGPTRWFATYPAVELDRKYDYRSRPWYGKAVSLSGISISPFYHDYITRLQSLTLSYEEVEGSLTLRLGADFGVGEGGTALGAQALNLVVLLGAALVYFGYYSSLQRRFVLLLALSTLVVALSYCLLVVNSSLVLLGLSDIASELMVSRLLAFLPSDSLLILAAVSLIRRPPAARTFFKLWAVEGFFALLNLLFSSGVFSAFFSFAALTTFGLSLVAGRHQFSHREQEEIKPNPASLSWTAGLSYCFWGFAQFTVIFVSADWPKVWQFLARRGMVGVIAETMMSEESAFTLLLFAKGVAVLLTIVYLAALQGARYKGELASFQAAPSFQVDDDCRIVGGWDFPVGFEKLRGRRFPDLIQSKEAAAEFEHAVREDVQLRNLRCRLRGDFADRLFHISIEPSNEEGTHLVSLFFVDKLALIGLMGRFLEEEVRLFVAGLRRYVLSNKEQSWDVKTFAQFSTYVDSEGARLESGASAALMGIDEEREDEHRSVEGKEAYGLLWRQTYIFICRNEGFQFSELSMPINAPKRLRIGPAVLGLILGQCFAEIELAANRMEVAEGRFEVGLLPGRDDWSPLGINMVSLIVRVSPGGFLKENIEAAERWELLGIDAVEDGDVMGKELSAARYLVRQFGGTITTLARGGVLELAIRLRFFRHLEEKRMGIN